MTNILGFSTEQGTDDLVAERVIAKAKEMGATSVVMVAHGGMNVTEGHGLGQLFLPGESGNEAEDRAQAMCAAASAQGLEATAQADLDDLYGQRYAEEPFVRLGGMPAPQRLAGSNVCWINAWVDERTGTVLIASALDNLVKGAAGQALQNANLVLGLPETAGLSANGVAP